jgi:hypothetical protein
MPMERLTPAIERTLATETGDGCTLCTDTSDCGKRSPRAPREDSDSNFERVEYLIDHADQEASH